MKSSAVLSPKLIKEAVYAYLHSPKLNQRLIKVGEEGLEAERAVSVGKEVVYEPDHHARHKFWKSMLEMKGMFVINVRHEVENKLSTLDREILQAYIDKAQKPKSMESSQVIDVILIQNKEVVSEEASNTKA